MKTQLAWHNLMHEKGRTLVATAGVIFALVLILMQLGFLGSVVTTATIIYDQLRFDVLITSPEYIDIRKTGTFPRQRLHQVSALKDVVDVQPLYIGLNVWRHPSTLRGRGILVLGTRNPNEVFNLKADTKPDYAALGRANAVLIDTNSRPEFGPQRPGIQTEVGGQQVEIAGQFTLGTGFCADGAILLGDQGFARLFPYQSIRQVNLGLVRLEPGADPKKVAEELKQILPPDTRVLTRDEINFRERRFWLVTTSVGVIFGLGTVVAVIVGVAIVYQVLSADITNHRSEYATLKAVGYGPRQLAKFVLQEAIILGVLGYFPAILLAEMLYRVTSSAANIPIAMTWGRAALVLGISLAMCTLSGLAALRKITVADPADLF